jgi:hypothetical protein
MDINKIREIVRTSNRMAAALVYEDIKSGCETCGEVRGRFEAMADWLRNDERCTEIMKVAKGIMDEELGALPLTKRP